LGNARSELRALSVRAKSVARLGLVGLLKSLFGGCFGAKVTKNGRQ
jgi:hypothetical protein